MSPQTAHYAERDEVTPVEEQQQPLLNAPIPSRPFPTGGGLSSDTGTVGTGAVSAAGATTTYTIKGQDGKSIRLTTLMISYSAAPTGGRVKVSDGVYVWDLDITAAGPQLLSSAIDEIIWTKGNDVGITLFSGGGAIVGKICGAYRIA